MKHKLIVFDLNDTLVDTSPALNYSLSKSMADEFNLDFDFVMESWLSSAEGVWSLPGIDTKKKFFEEFDRRFFEKIGEEDNEETWKRFRRAIENGDKLLEKEIKPFEGVLEVLQELKERGFRMAILNETKAKNTVVDEPEDEIDKKEEHLIAILENTGIAQYLDALFLGAKKRVLKPNKEAFDLPLKHFEIDSSQAIMVGDKDKDIMAKNFGYTSILFDPKKKYSKETKPDYVFHHWADFLKIIDSISSE